MSMNIKSEEAHQLAAELAKLRGVSLTQAVTDAIRTELERERAKRKRVGLAEELLEIGRRCAERMKDPVPAEHATDFLYDERGLPK
jgi:antitoxin VapB